jgi:endonuclease III-like uncharacterized protein
MNENNLEQLIIEGIKGLPQESLAEIIDFIYFMRKKVIQPEAYQEELLNELLDLDMKRLDYDEAIHLEKEFEGYDKIYPCE